MKRFFRQKNKQNGFTLIETLVAIAIFTLSVLALMTSLSNGTSNTEYAKKKIIASYLAQEGIEYVRNVRDTYALYSASTDAGWTAFNSKMANASCSSANGCYFNPDNLFSLPQPMPITRMTFAVCGGACPKILYDAASGKYNYTTGTDSGYSRQMKVTTINANETKIFSTVFWKQNSGTYSITLSESLYNWIQ